MSQAAAKEIEWNGLPVPRRYWALGALWLAIAMAVLDSAIANVALPTIARAVHAAPAEAIWVVNAYQLTIVVSLLPMAALGEIVGYRRVFLSGLLIFIAASAACTMVDSLLGLAVARAVQGIGAGVLLSILGALIRYAVPARMLGRTIGYNAVIVAVFAAIGPTVASGILAVGPWQWLFAVNVPIGLAAFVVGRVSLPESERSDHRFDILATLLNVATFGLIVTGTDLLTRAHAYLLGGGELALGLLAGAALVRRSLSQRRPLMPIDLLRNRLFSLSVLASIASFAAQMIGYVALPFYFETVMQRGQVQTGLLMTPWPAAVGLAAPIAGHLADRHPAAILGGGGLALFAAGLVSLAVLPADASTLDVIWRMALCGFGFGFFQSPNNRVLLASAPLNRTGAAAGMLGMARLTGQIIGATVTAIVFSLVPGGETIALGVAAAFAATAAAVSLSRLGIPPHTDQPP